MIRTSSESAPETAPEEPRVGVYVCKCGGNISDVVDVQAVADAMKGLPGVVISQVHTFMCSDPGQAMIAEDIKKHQLNRVVVASCSPFLHELTFRTAVKRGGLNPYLYEHVNIREQSSWAHKSDPAGATAKAMRAIAAAIGKLAHVRPLENIKLTNHRQALVIGGGIAGLKAATDLAGRGLPVLLVEQSGYLGGRVAALSRVYPTEEEGRELVQRLVDEAREHPKIQIFTHAKLASVSGFMGNYDVKIAVEPPASSPAADPFAGVPVEPARTGEITAAVGVIVLATGFDPYTPADGEYGFGRQPTVVTLPEFIKRLAQLDGAELVWNGRPIRQVGFMHCVGSRQLEGVNPPQSDGKVNDYCSRTCCTAVLQQALALKEKFPAVHVYDFHQDIRAYGPGHEDYYTRASKAGVTFLRWHADEPPAVEPGSNGAALQVRVKDWLTWGEEIIVPVDLLVLAVGMMPRDIKQLIEQLKVPVGADRFLQEVHPKLRPVETSVNGVLLAGTAQAPMTITETLASASAAAAKAAALLAREHVELEPFKALVDPARCIGCDLCFAECAYSGALVPEEVTENGKTVKKAKVNPGLCVGCGACVPVCPTRAIDLQGWTLEQFDAMVDGLVGAPQPADSTA
jgi:heterodisulfide reductase subunit A